MLVRASYTFLFILAVCCWFRHNAAVPLASYSLNQMQDAFKEKQIDSESDLNDSILNSRSIRETETISDKKITSKEEIFHPFIEKRSEDITKSLSTSKEEEEIISEVVTEESTPFAFAKDIFTKSLEVYASQSTASVDTSSLETKITESSSAKEMEEYSKPEEDRDKSSTILTSEELGKVDYISSSTESIVASSEVDIESDISAKSPELIEFTKEPMKPDRIFDKLSEKPISTKNVSKTVTMESSKITEHSTVTNVATTTLIPPEDDSKSIKHIAMNTRRNTITSTPQHKLKIKILLEHINENKEKHNLVEVEHLSLDENPEHHLNSDLLEQLKSLYDSVNMKIISALLNCISLDNLTKNLNFVNEEPDNVDSDTELEFTNTDFENFNSEQFISDSDDAKIDYSEYEEHVTSRRRRRRSLDNEMEDLNKFRQNLYDSTDSTVDAFNISQTQNTELTNTTYNLQLFTTTNYSEEETTTNDYTESERNVTKEENQSTMPSIIIINLSNVDLSNASESRDINMTKDVQLNMTTYKPEEETNNTMYIETNTTNDTNMINEGNESTVPSTKNNMINETKMEVVRETLSGIQEDVVVGLQHMVSQLTQNNLTSINNVKEAIKTNLLGILMKPRGSIKKKKSHGRNWILIK
ncbi:PREDICTED: reticulocyte-binding protein 2-like isoform X1 [Acromyrmex echinatior]|uniref:reticulocyte-binding protein 2-like isoform X1 n=2 Tax=Acromyrmex echinatior TaxID=103372 RepID=UPI000580C0AB|nr:PREDICTED: reticulocyte-binding protein 2-like isoform X1 [Acromyrmex echinatior]